MKAAKFHSCGVGHLIDCKLTVIEQDWALLLRRDMALRLWLARPAGSPALLVYGHQSKKIGSCFYPMLALITSPSLCALR